MALIQIMKRGSEDDVHRFEQAIYDAKEALDEICEIYEQMKSQFDDRDGAGYSSRGGYSGRSWSYRDGHGPEWGERRSRNSMGQYR